MKVKNLIAAGCFCVAVFSMTACTQPGAVSSDPAAEYAGYFGHTYSKETQ